MELTGKIAIVTGASKGIGLEVVKALIKEGVNVAGWSRSEMQLQDERFLHCRVNIRDSASVQQAYELTRKHFGGEVLMLVNNAGLGYAGAIEDIKENEWLEMFETNVHGLFYCSQKVIPAMKRLGEGHIFNIASIAGTMGVEHLSGYCGTKFAVRGISQSMYKELRDYGIKVTTITPGSVKTQFFNNMDMIVPNDQMMRPEDVADTILYLLKTPENFHPVEIELRPLMPKGRKTV